MIGLPLERCCNCDDPTGKAGAGDGSLYTNSGYGPFCDSCYAGACWTDAELTRLRAIEDENYSDLLDQMDASWGNAREIGREEINAFLESRIVHKPTTRLRAVIQRAGDVIKTRPKIPRSLSPYVAFDIALDALEEALK